MQRIQPTKKVTSTMNYLLRVILRREKVFIKNGNQSMSEQLKVLTCRNYNCMKVSHPGHKVLTDDRDTSQHLVGIVRAFTNDIKSTGNDNNGNKDTRTVVIQKTISRLVKKKRLKEALEDRQRKIQRGVENVLEDRRAALTNTRKRIQERGKLIMQDIKETKEKMKERIEEVIEKENIYTIPNFICVTRIGLSPLLGYLIVAQKFEYALVFMTFAGVSDWVDGYIARNYKSQSSKIGSFLDPMADKVLIGTLFLSLTYVDLIPVPLTALILGRDVILIISGFVIRYRSLPPPRTLSRYFDVTHATAQLAPTFISKINTGIQLVLVGTTLAAPVLGYVNHQFLQVLCYITATSTVVAASSYIFSKETYRYFKSKETVKSRKK